VIDEEIAALKWKLWHGQVDRAISALQFLEVPKCLTAPMMGTWRAPSTKLMLARNSRASASAAAAALFSGKLR